MKPSYYKPYLIETLIDEGIVVTDGPNNDYIKTVPNDDKVTKLVREAIAIINEGDEDRIMEFICKWRYPVAGWSYPEFSMLGMTVFMVNGKPASLSQVQEEIEIKRFKEEYPNG